MFCELVEKDKSFSIYQKNIRNLATEICKFLNNLSPCNYENHLKAIILPLMILENKTLFETEIPVL